VRKVAKVRSMLGCQPRSVCLRRCLCAMRIKHALHFVQNLEIPKSVARNFDRYGICVKYQRRWHDICARGLCVKLLKLKINVRWSAEICLLQTLFVRIKHDLRFLQNLKIPKIVARNLTDMESVWNTKDGDTEYVLVGCAENCVKLV